MFSRAVSKSEIKKFVEDNSIEYYVETSAVTGLNTKDLFIDVGKMLYTDYINYSKNPSKSMFSRASIERTLRETNQLIDAHSSNVRKKIKSKKDCCN